MNQKNKEQDQKLENIIQNIADNEIRIIEQNKEINNVDKKFNLLTTYIDNQNEDNYNTQYNNIIARNFDECFKNLETLVISPSGRRDSNTRPLRPELHYPFYNIS